MATIARSSVSAEALSDPVNPLIGVGLKVLSALSFTFMSAGIKWLGSDYPTGQIVFFRSAFALVPLLVWLALRGDLLASVRTSNLRSHIIRGLMGSCAMFSGFVSLAYLPLSDSVVIGYLSPLLTVVLAAIFLGETIRVYRWTAVAVGFIGVVIMVSPHLGTAALTGDVQTTTIGVAFGLLGACCAAGATIQVRRLTSRESTGAIVLYFTLLTTALGASTILLGWRVPSAPHFALLVTIGILGGIGQILMTQSYRYADASLIAPFDYTTMIWAVLLGWFLFGQLPGTAVVIGGTVVAAAGLFVIWREHRLGLQRAKHVEAGSQRVT